MTAAAANWVFTCDQGKTLTKRLRFGSRTGGVFVPFDNTGYEARMMWKKTYTSSTAAVDVSTTTGEIVLGGVNGEIEF